MKWLVTLKGIFGSRTTLVCSADKEDELWERLRGLGAIQSDLYSPNTVIKEVDGSLYLVTEMMALQAIILATGCLGLGLMAVFGADVVFQNRVLMVLIAIALPMMARLSVRIHHNKAQKMLSDGT